MSCSRRYFAVAKYPEDSPSRLDHSRQSHDHLRQSGHFFESPCFLVHCASLLAIPAICLLLVACSKVTAENYAKVKAGMEYKEVTAILGNPDRCDDLAGFKSCTWGDAKSHVNVRFAGDKAILHSAENIK